MTDVFTKAIIQTERLRLEPFKPSHAKALKAINNEAEVMRYLSSGQPETLDDTLNTIKRVRERWATLGYSWWAIIETRTEAVIGAACLQHVAGKLDAELEIGWRLTGAATGYGYATEAGSAAAQYAFDVIGVDHVIATAHQDNLASHKVMQRIGMIYRGVEKHYDIPSTTYELRKSDGATAPTAPFRS